MNKKYKNSEYWKNYMEDYFGSDLIAFWEENAEEKWIKSGERDLHIEIYEKNHNNSTIVFSHGIAGYARLMLPFIKPLYEWGFNVIVPDLTGYGYNKGKRGKFEFDWHVEDLGNTLNYARDNFNGSLFLGGGSMGGPLAYCAAARYGGIDGLLCWCLFDFQDKEFIAETTQHGKWTFSLLKILKLVSKLFGNLRIKNETVISYKDLSVKEVADLVREDPHSGTKMTLNAAISLLTQSIPDISYRDWKLPSLIVQPGADAMTPPKFTKKVYDQLGTEIKKYVIVEDALHYPVERQHYLKFADEVKEFVISVENNL